jgi:hypothetical protein
MSFDIPAWNSRGVLPPIGVADPTSAIRSPYVVPLSEVVQRFGTTLERRTILNGLLRYRAALHAVGLVQGFQWLNGSFLEDIESLEGRPPNDIDVVTFFRLMPGETEDAVVQRALDLFPDTASAQRALKQRFHVDAYMETLDAPPEELIRQCTYWYSMWSHRRNFTWKGYLQVDLAPLEDAAVSGLLASLTAAGAQP